METLNLKECDKLTGEFLLSLLLVVPHRAAQAAKLPFFLTRLPLLPFLLTIGDLAQLRLPDSMKSLNLSGDKDTPMKITGASNEQIRE